MWGHTCAHMYLCCHYECDCGSACPCKRVLGWHKSEQARLMEIYVHMGTMLRFPPDPPPWFLLFPLHTQEAGVCG